MKERYVELIYSTRTMKNITNYFRNAITAQVNPIINFKSSEFITIFGDEINKGGLLCQRVNDINFLFENKKADEEYSDIILALKTVGTSFKEGVRISNTIDDLSAILLLPAKINRNGKFFVAGNGKSPWIPREYLLPLTEPQLSVGQSEVYDQFLEENIDVFEQIVSWLDYLKYAISMYETVTLTKINSNTLIYNESEMKFDEKYYLFADTTVNATRNVKNLYNDLLCNERKTPLYDTLIQGIPPHNRILIEDNDIEAMKTHDGQMGAEYALSPSQRESVIHFNQLVDGELLAVNGPPGTGKTTLLQSIVADLYVKHALKKYDAPIIVATSTNNQAVTNIIDSFAGIRAMLSSNLEQRWIEGVTSLATYFPSSAKAESNKNLKYQYTNLEGQFFYENLESDVNIEMSKKTMLDKTSNYFGIVFTDIAKCKQIIFTELENINIGKNNIFILMKKFKNEINDLSYNQYVTKLNNQIVDIINQVDKANNYIENQGIKIDEFKQRKTKWRSIYDELPILIRIFKIIPYCKKRINNWMYDHIQTNDLDVLNRRMSIDEIEIAFESQINLCDENIIKQKKEIGILKTDISRKKQMLEKVTELVREFKKQFEILDSYKVTVFKNDSHRDEVIDTFDIVKINQLFDTSIRYIMFWLAVHYYECEWLDTIPKDNEHKIQKNYKKAMEIRYKRLSMVTPCFVMTFYMLPKNFLMYDTNQRKQEYMYNYIDLLITDESGQSSPEIAACSFALAKKAIVVGDEQQIEPVWSTSRVLDVSMAIKNNVIKNKTEFNILEKNGLNCSESSLMKIASNACAYNKYERGLFLSEHRRCYNEIINYCNDLVYNGKLEPLRGNSNNDNPIKNIIPCMGYYQVNKANSTKSGCSRYNIDEARGIAKWIKENYDDICNAYSYNLNDGETLKENDIFGIITPFKSQVGIISKVLKQELGKRSNNIVVGTVHTFQGAERNIIIFSSVYGKNDGCFFINKNKSLMNVAVSRAKDSFLVFGDRGCLVDGENSASGLLKKYVQDKIN